MPKKKQLSLQEIEQAISDAEPEKQRHLLADLPHLLKISTTDFALLKVSEKAFGFWNNPDDAIYDRL